MQREEVDDVDSTLKTRTPFTGLASNVAAHVAEERATTAPNPVAQGTALSVAGTAVAHAEVAPFGARSIDLMGPVPRGAPV